MQLREYPLRLTRGEDGVYRWKGKFSKQQRKKAIRITLGTCGGICLLILALTLSAGAKGEVLAATLISILAVMVIAGVICALYARMSKDRYQPYEMGEDYLRFVGYGKADSWITFQNIRRVKIVPEQDLISVRTALVWAPFFVPHEDFAFVRNYVLLRLPPTAVTDGV